MSSIEKTLGMLSRKLPRVAIQNVRRFARVSAYARETSTIVRLIMKIQHQNKTKIFKETPTLPLGKDAVCKVGVDHKAPPSACRATPIHIRIPKEYYYGKSPVSSVTISHIICGIYLYINRFHVYLSFVVLNSSARCDAQIRAVFALSAAATRLIDLGRIDPSQPTDRFDHDLQHVMIVMVNSFNRECGVQLTDEASVTHNTTHNISHIYILDCCL